MFFLLSRLIDSNQQAHHLVEHILGPYVYWLRHIDTIERAEGLAMSQPLYVKMVEHNQWKLLEQTWPTLGFRAMPYPLLLLIKLSILLQRLTPISPEAAFFWPTSG
jgi:hypothetical protein